MKSFLRQLVAPTSENGRMPRALSPQVLIVLTIVGAVLIVSPTFSRRSELASLSEVTFGGDEVISFINSSRATQGLSPLNISETLNLAAEARARDMLENQYFSHVSPDSMTPWDFLRSAGYVYTAAGENLALDFVSASEAHEAFMTSPTHRANILNRLYTEVGIAVLKGTYEGRSTVFIVEFFGNPRSAIAAVPSEAPAPAAVVSTPVPAEEEVSPEFPPAPQIAGAEEEVSEEDTTPPVASTEGAISEEEDFTVPVPASVEEGPGEGNIVLPWTREELIYLGVRVAAFGAVFLLALALVFLMSRTRKVAVGLVSHVLVLILVFGYIGTFGVGSFSISEIGPSAVSTSVIETRS